MVNTLEMTAVKTALLIRDDHGLQYLFVIPFVAILFSGIYAAIFMPETYGLSLKEIGDIYSDGVAKVQNCHDKVVYHSKWHNSILLHLKRAQMLNS